MIDRWIEGSLLSTYPSTPSRPPHASGDRAAARLRSPPVDTVTVALPVLNGEAHLDETLRAVRRQRAPGPVELLVADSGSKDRSMEIALGYGARIVEIPRREFSHGGTRNLLMSEAGGSRV